MPVYYNVKALHFMSLLNVTYITMEFPFNKISVVHLFRRPHYFLALPRPGRLRCSTPEQWATALQRRSGSSTLLAPASFFFVFMRDGSWSSLDGRVMITSLLPRWYIIPVDERPKMWLMYRIIGFLDIRFCRNVYGWYGPPPTFAASRLLG